MAVGIIIHVTVGAEKRTEFFAEETIRFGSTENNNLQIKNNRLAVSGTWLEFALEDNVYRINDFNESLNLRHNGRPIRRFVGIRDGDVIDIADTDISLSFFSLASQSSMITTNRESHIAQFIETAALDSAFTPQRDDAKAFLREFVRELFREISWTTKFIFLILALGSISGILYLGYAFNNEQQKNRQLTEKQSELVRQLQDKLSQTSDQIGELDKSNKDIMKTVSLTQNVRVEYGSGVCLIVGVYDLVDRKTGKTLRYPNPQDFQASQFEPTPSEDEIPTEQSQMNLTTEGSGSEVEYDFIGTGFYVGSGFVLTNRHVLQPWEEDDLVKQMMKESNGRARIKKLSIYFPNIPQPFTLKVRQLGSREDLAVGSVDEKQLPPEIPILPLDGDSEAVSVGKTVVTMGYPNGPDRLLAMSDDEEAKSINTRFGGSRQSLINFLAQSRKIVPLTTQGAITDLDARRIVHDAKTAEGGSGAPLFGQTGKVIGVNFGIFTQSNAANMAIPIRFAIDLLKRVGWKTPEEIKNETVNQNQNASANTNNSVTQNKAQ